MEKDCLCGNQSKMIGFKMEDSIWIGNGSRWVEAEYTMQEYSALHLYSTCGLAIHVGKAVMFALVQQGQLLQGIRISHYFLYLGRRYTSQNQIGFCMAVETCLQRGNTRSEDMVTPHFRKCLACRLTFKYHNFHFIYFDIAFTSSTRAQCI